MEKDEKRVLLIEPVGRFAEVLTYVLKVHKYKVDLAERVTDIDKMLDSHKYSLVVSELCSRDYDRRSKIMKDNVRNFSIPLIILDEEPESLPFCEKLGTKYSPNLVKGRVSSDELFQGLVSSLEVGLSKLKGMYR